MRRFVPTLGALAACTTALAGAPASVLTFDVVDNGGGSDGFVNLAGTTTIDVYFNNISGASIDGIVGFDFGAAGPGQTRGLAVTNSAVLVHHGLGGDTRSPAQEASFPLVAFDSFWVMGDTPVVFSGSVDLTGADGDLNGRFMLDGGASIDLGFGERVRFARLTFDEGLLAFPREFAVLLSNGDELVYLPTPGAAGVLALAGIGMLRRRR